MSQPRWLEYRGKDRRGKSRHQAGARAAYARLTRTERSGRLSELAEFGRSGALGQDNCVALLETKPALGSLWNHPSTPKRLRICCHDKNFFLLFTLKGLFPPSKLDTAASARASWGLESAKRPPAKTKGGGAKRLLLTNAGAFYIHKREAATN